MHKLTADKDVRVGVVGASGFAGAELLKILASHHYFNLEVAVADTKQGMRIVDLYPNLSFKYEDKVFDSLDIEKLSNLDIVFLALPHGLSMSLVPQLGKVPLIVDLGADFRLQDQALYPKWYGVQHSAGALLKDFVYGLPELFHKRIVSANRIAATGCNASAAIFALAPFLAEGLIAPDGIVVDIKAGLSGAGRPPKESNVYCKVADNVEAYSIEGHRHIPEVEQCLADISNSEPKIDFMTHLVPVSRGILATAYSGAIRKLSTNQLHEHLSEFYSKSPCVRVVKGPPSTKAVQGSNMVQISAIYNERTNKYISMVAIDNLVKGSAGMAIQCANLATGLDETEGLNLVGMMP